MGIYSLNASEALSKTGSINLTHPGMDKSDTVEASGKLFLNSVAEDSLSLKRKSMSVNDGIYNPSNCDIPASSVSKANRSAMSKQEKKESRKKLKLELEQVLGFTTKIEERVFRLKVSCEYAGDNTCNSSQVSKMDGVDGEEFAGKKATSVPGCKFKKSRSFTGDSQTAGSSMVLSDANLNTPRSVGMEKRMPKANQMYRNSEYVSGNQKIPLPEKPKSRVSTGAKRPATKRRLQEKVVIGSKHQKLEQVPLRRMGEIMRQCGTLLKRLMSHKHSWVFNEPVDAVKFGLSDYHQVVRSPMDLGTIKNKLASGQYSNPLEFAADVRLTFANAMKYNPKGHDVHVMADILQKLFEDKWRYIDEKMKERMTETLEIQGDTQELLELKRQLQRLKGQVVSLSKSNLTGEKERCQDYSHRDMSLNEKMLLIEKVKNAPGDAMERVIHILKEGNPDLILDDADVEVDLESFDLKTLWELDHFLTNCARSKGKSDRITQKNIQIQNEGKEASKVSLSVEIAVEGDSSKFSRFSSSTTDSGLKTSSSDSGAGSSPPCFFESEDAQTVINSVVQASTPKETEHPRSCGLDEDNLGFQSCEVEESQASNDGVHTKFKEAPPTRQLSPDKLLRAALLKGRFADTILKAQEKTLPISKNGKVDPAKLKKEREENERRQREEKNRLQAEAKAAELARKKADADAAVEMRRKREKEREAARLALQQMERTVEFNQEIEFSRDLEILGNGPPEQHSSSSGDVSPASSPDDLHAFGFRLGNPLEQLGLFMKDDYEDDDEKQGVGEAVDGEIAYESGDVEEGEI